ncbi:MAG: hypothetical protein LIO92_00820 [Clostridiales bacterium]|nr:hypothetical protein [Clostridiales bacterium]
MKKSLKALLLAMVLVMVPVASFAASSSTTTTTSASRDNSNNASGHSSSGGGGGSSSSSSSSSSSTVVAGSSSSTSSGIVEATYTSVTNGQSETWSVGATYTRLNDGVVTALVGDVATDELEAANPSTAYAAVGICKLAGLPEYVKTIIGQVDYGDMSAVPGVDLTGYQTYGTTIAVRSEAGSVATIYCSELPASGAKILFYNNWTQTWSLIDCTVDAEAGTVTFVAPTSGTAQIVGA